MGMFMQTVSFLKPFDWENKRPLVESALESLGIAPECTNLQKDLDAYCIMDAYGHMGPVFEELAGTLSGVLGGFCVYAFCVDSDFNLLALYENGSCLNRCAIGAVFEEMLEGMDVREPDLSQWSRLLPDPNGLPALQAAMEDEEVFAEDILQKLSAITGLPIFDDGLLTAAAENGPSFDF